MKAVFIYQAGGLNALKVGQRQVPEVKPR